MITRNNTFSHLYHPVQPAVGMEPTAAVNYMEHRPSDALKPYVYCYWVLRSETVLSAAFTYQVVSDGCIDLLIDCATFEGLIVAGTAARSTKVDLQGKFKYFGIRFLPGSFHVFFPIKSKELANKMVDGREVWGHRISEFEGQLFSAPNTAERIEVAEHYLLKQLNQERLPDERFQKTLQHIYRHQGRLPIENNPANLISPRQLRRLFERYIGISPKTFARVVRFQHILQAMLRMDKKYWPDLHLNFGYYDQAHFIHEFKEFFGSPPMSATIF